MLEKLAQLKRRLRYLILRPSEERKPVNLEPIWNVFANFELDKGENEKRCVPTPNPSLLYTISDCEDFIGEPGKSGQNSRRKSKAMYPCKD